MKEAIEIEAVTGIMIKDLQNKKINKTKDNSLPKEQGFASQPEYV